MNKPLDIWKLYVGSVAEATASGASWGVVRIERLAYVVPKYEVRSNRQHCSVSDACGIISCVCRTTWYNVWLNISGLQMVELFLKWKALIEEKKSFLKAWIKMALMGMGVFKIQAYTTYTYTFVEETAFPASEFFSWSLRPMYLRMFIYYIQGISATLSLLASVVYMGGQSELKFCIWNYYNANKILILR